MTTAVKPKNMSAWIKSGTAVTATSASDVARQAGLDWTVSLHEVSATYQIPGQGSPVHIPVKNKQAVVKTTAMGEVTPLGVVGSKYKPFQNGEVFSCGVCDSCAFRLDGFKLAGIKDGVRYQDL